MTSRRWNRVATATRVPGTIASSAGTIASSAGTVGRHARPTGIARSPRPALTAAAPDGDCPPHWHVAECLLPGLTRANAEEIGQRARQQLAVAAATGVSFVGSLLLPEDELLLCVFSGPRAEVRSATEQAGLPFERIVPCIGLGWRPAGDAGP